MFDRYNIFGCLHIVSPHVILCGSKYISVSLLHKHFVTYFIKTANQEKKRLSLEIAYGKSKTKEITYK